MPRVALTLNFPRTELLREGWADSRTANAMQAGRWELLGSSLTGVGAVWDWRREALPEGLWREPNTGVIMLRPGTMFPTAFEDPFFLEYLLTKSDLQWGNDDEADEVQNPAGGSLMVMKRPTGSTLTALLVTLAMIAIKEAFSVGFDWVGKTVLPLKANEGFSVVIDPAGLVVDRAKAFMGFHFGGRFAMKLTTAGEFAVYYNFGSDESADWREIHRESFKSGSVDHKVPYQVTVIPWGFSYLGMYFSQVNLAASLGVSVAPKLGVRGTGAPAFLVDLSEHGIECPWDDTIAQHVKTAAAPLHIGVDMDRFMYVFGVTKVRYPESATLDTGPVVMDEPKSTLPQIFTRGFFDYDGSRPMAPTITASRRGVEGGVWSLDDEQGTFRFVLGSSPGREYSPELWNYDAEVPASTFTPDWTPVDASARWTMIRIGLTARSQAAQITVKMEGGEVARMFHRGGPVRVGVERADGSETVPVFDGYFLTREPTMTGAVVPGLVRGKVREEASGQDMWHRLNTVSMARSVSLDDKTIGDVLRMAIMRAGFLAEEVEIDDDEAFGLAVSEAFTPEQLKNWNADTYVGDIVRDIQKFMAPQSADGLRVRWVGDRWRVYFAYAWDAAEIWPKKVFLLDGSLMAVWDAAMATAFDGVGRSDLHRWNPSGTFGEESFYLVSSNFEPDVRLPAFNCLEVVASKGDKDGDGGLLAVVDPDPRVMLDPDSPLFEGRLRKEIKGPPEVTEGSPLEVQRWARFIYDQEQRGGVTCGVQAEWQPELGPDDFVMVLGRNEEGDPVSFGCWRIETIDVELRSDRGQDWDWSGSYDLVYQGPTFHPSFPMFNEVEV